jgi:hypothetical protein
MHSSHKRAFSGPTNSRPSLDTCRVQFQAAHTLLPRRQLLLLLLLLLWTAGSFQHIKHLRLKRSLL